MFEDQIEFIVDQYLAGTGPVSNACTHARYMPVRLYASVCFRKPVLAHSTQNTRIPHTRAAPQEVEETKEEAAKREREAREAEQRSEFENIQVARRLLPMFPYRCAVSSCVWGVPVSFALWADPIGPPPAAPVPQLLGAWVGVGGSPGVVAAVACWEDQSLPSALVEALPLPPAAAQG